MRKRMDFASISEIILDNLCVEGMTNAEYYYSLFFYAFEQDQYKITEPDNGDISRYLNGQRGIPKDIIRLYQTDEKFGYLRKGMANVLNSAVDKEYVKEQVYTLLQGDVTISLLQRKEIAGYMQEADMFLSRCLLFGMTRKFVPKGKEKKADSTIVISEFLLDYQMPSVRKVFLGRDREIEEIHSQLSENECLFLTGIGGIGKSELAKQYANRHKIDYENVIYLRYIDNLKKTIAGLNFVDDNWDMSEEKRFLVHYNFFKMLNDKTLVILDNFDTLPERDELFHEFLNMKFQLLVTTRSHIDGVSCYNINEIMELENLLEIFYAYMPKSRDKESVVIEIIEEVYHHTLTVEMAAKTLQAAHMEPEQLLIELRKEGIRLSNPNKINVQY